MESRNVPEWVGGCGAQGGGGVGGGFFDEKATNIFSYNSSPRAQKSLSSSLLIIHGPHLRMPQYE